MRDLSTEQKRAGNALAQNDAPRNALAGLPASFERALRAQNKAKTTIKSYMDVLRFFYTYLAHKGMPLAIASIRREHIEQWLVDLQTEPNLRTSKPLAASTLNKHYKALNIYFNWARDEGEIRTHPMEKMKRPIIPENPPPVLSVEDIEKLLKACSAKDFYSKRDTAIFRLLLDTGMRVSELVGIKLTDINWQHNSVTVLGKGRRERTVPFGRKTSQALDRYIRARTSYPTAHLPHLWLGHAGKALTDDGVRIMMRKRGEQAGVENVHPHMFRHELAHTWLSEGGTEGGLMRIMDWKSRTMLARYGASAATKRAHEEHGRLQPGDKF